jgi:hypothetical protein
MKRICFGVLFFVSILHNTSAINYQCSVCPIGKYKSATSNNECVNCPANTYQDITAATSPTQCKPCPSNSYAPAGSGRNTQCLCGLGYTGDVASYSTGPRNMNLQRSCGAMLTDSCDALQSSSTTLSASRAVDADSGTQSIALKPVSTDTNYFNGATKAWWRVKFERQAIVQNVELINTDFLKMGSFSIRVGNFDYARMAENPLCAENVDWPVAPATLAVTCTQALQGQYLYIINGADTNIILNDVKVIGYLVPVSEVCVACTAGKFKSLNGTSTCTACGAGKASAFLAATAVSTCGTCGVATYAAAGDATCSSCPSDSNTIGTLSPSSAFCICNAGFLPAPSTPSCTEFQALYKSKRPWAHYSADSANWNAQTQVLSDVSGNNRNSKPAAVTLLAASNRGSIAVQNGRDRGSPNDVPFLRGLSTDRLDFAENSVPQSFTICSVTRYASTTGNQQRILTTTSATWYHGHFMGQRGVARYASRSIIGADGFESYTAVANTAEANIEPTADWVVMCSKNGGVVPENVLINGMASGTSTRSDGNAGEWAGTTQQDKINAMEAGRTRNLCINCFGNGNGAQTSDWDLSQLLIWDMHLTDSEMQTVSNELRRYVMPLNTACSTRPGEGCNACPAGTYNSEAGSSLCINCGAGKYRSTPAATAESNCIPCPANTFSFTANTERNNCMCNAGYAAGENGVACVACAAGSYKSAVGIGTCTSCAVNEYSTTLAQVVPTCSSCPLNSKAPAGSDEATDCQCNAGYTGANGQACIACVPGTYKTTDGPDKCTLCGNNTFSPAVAATSSSVCLGCQTSSSSLMGSTRQSDCKCLPGYITNNLGFANATCQVCSAGSFNAQLDATTCSSCGAGYRSSNPGAVSLEDCVQCGVDTYSAAGAAQCEICPQNTFAPGLSKMLSDCKCLAGYYSAVTGQDGLVCSACEAGKHKARTGAVPCTDCLVHQFSTATAATSNGTCVPCATNAVSVAGSSDSSMCLCNLGFTGSNAAGCAGCAAGKFKPSTGADACTNCLANTYSSRTAQSSSATCTPCYDNSVSLAGSDHIDDCSCSAGFEFS